MSAENKEWKEKYQTYIKSPEWYELKLDLLAKRGCKCERCGRKKQAQVLHIHHLTYERLYNEQAADLEILCPICHMKAHGLIKEKIKRSEPVKKSKGYKNRKNKKSQKKLREHLERVANEKFTGAKRRRMKGKGNLKAWQQ